MTLPTGALPDGLDVLGLADRLTTVDGVCGVMLGGSRARGEQAPESDVDLGLYYSGDLDVAALDALARDVAGPDASVTKPGDWGRWVDGGGWLVIRDVHVDWIYRDLYRVRESWAKAHRGAYQWNSQTGHPLGVPDFAYVGEVALGEILADRTGELTDFKSAIEYPDALSAALVANLWEVDFLVTGAGKATGRGDATYVALCISRALLLCAHALHGRDRRWLVNEKGAIASASQLPSTPTGFADRATELLGTVGTTQEQLAASLDTARDLVDEVRTACTTTS